MKRNIIILIFFIPLFTLAQKKSLTYNQTQDIKFAKKYKNNTAIDSYTTKDGLIISVGDTLVIGNAINKKKKYLFDDVFSHIVIGKVKGTTNQEYRYLPHNYSGNKVIVKSLFVTHEKFTGYKLWVNKKDMPLYVSVFVREFQGGFSEVFSHSRKTILDIEEALSSGEVANDHRSNQSAVNFDEKKYELLLKLGNLKESGVLTEEEFQEEKKKILERE